MSEPASQNSRCILHVDMDAFFAAIEVLDFPELSGQPILMGHDGPRSVVSTASYEARKFGCGSAMPMSTAKRLCPQAIIRPIRGQRIREVSQQIFAIFHDFTPLVEGLSSDEAFLDVSGSTRLFGGGVAIAQQIRHRIKSEIGLTASVGVAPNKFLAKIASDHNKPDGLTVIDADRVQSWLDPLPVERLWGVGKVTHRRLSQLNIKTVKDLRCAHETLLHQGLGEESDHFLRLAQGIDHRKVIPEHQAKSIGQERTYDQDINDPDILRDLLFNYTEEVGYRVRRHGMKARTVSIKLRFGNFQTITRASTLEQATDRTELLWHQARGLFDQWAKTQFKPLRLLGVTAGKLSIEAEQQSNLFGKAEEDRQHQLDELSDQIKNRFGKKAIKRGGANR